MAKITFVLKDVTDFAPGAFENTAVQNGSIRLGYGGGGFLATGTYTSIPFTSVGFRKLIPCWNSDTPPGTHVEVQARIVSGGRWSQWFSFGTWSPFIDRCSASPYHTELAHVEGEMLTIADGVRNADTAQLRVILFTNDATVSPSVRLLAVSTDADIVEEQYPHTGRPIIEVPTYSCLVRDPSVAQHIACPTALAMMMNRWGEDVLPEEVARASYDSKSARFSNLSFIAAIAGAYGYECYSSYGSIEMLRREIWRGHSIGALVRYRAPLLGGHTDEGVMPGDAGTKPEMPADALSQRIPGLGDVYSGAPVLEGASMDSSGHLVVVRGFKETPEGEMVVVNDPLAPDDQRVQREIPLERFKEIYTGLCLVLHLGPKGSGSAKPVRITGDLELENNKIHLLSRQKPMQDSDGNRHYRTSLCYTLSDGVAYASAAQKKFYYPRANEDATINFDPSFAGGRKLSFYQIGPLGSTWVAEKTIPKTEPADGD